MSSSATVSPSTRQGMGTILYAGGAAFRVWAPFASRVGVAGTYWASAVFPGILGGPCNLCNFFPLKYVKAMLLEFRRAACATLCLACGQSFEVSPLLPHHTSGTPTGSKPLSRACWG